MIKACVVLLALLASGCASNLQWHGEFMPGYARALAWSPDAKQIVVIGKADLVVLDATTRKPLFTHKGASKLFALYIPAAAIVFSLDGKTCITAGVDNGVVLWDTATWQPIARLPGADGSTALALTPDGTRLWVAGPDTGLMLYDLALRKRLLTLISAPSNVIALALSPDGSHLATGEMHHQVRVWHLPDNIVSTTIKGYVGPVFSVAFSPDGARLAAAATGRDVRVVALDNPQRALTLVDPAKPTAEHSAAESLVTLVTFVGMVRTIQLTGAPSGLPVEHVAPSWPDFNCPVRFSPDGHYVALIRFSQELSSNYHVEVYAVNSGMRVSRYSGGISALAFSPDGQQLAVSGITQLILLDPHSGKAIDVD